MNSEQIINILKNDPYSKEIFKGVYAIYEVPPEVPYPSAYVINSDPSLKPGQHWLAAYFDHKNMANISIAMVLVLNYLTSPILWTLCRLLGDTANNSSRTIIDHMCTLLCILFVVQMPWVFFAFNFVSL